MESIDPDSAGRHALLHSRQLVQELERKNREIMSNIHQLREQSRQQRYGQMGPQSGQVGDPRILNELQGLRHHKEQGEVSARTGFVLRGDRKLSQFESGKVVV